MDVYDLVEKQFLSDLEKSSDHTKAVRLTFCRQFLNYAKQNSDSLNGWNKEIVNAFMRDVITLKYSGGSPRLAYSVVKRTFDAAKRVYELERCRMIGDINPQDPGAIATVLKAISLPGPVWDVGKRDAPPVTDELRPKFTDEQAMGIISAAKSGKFTAAETAYACLGSVYAYRREELSKIRPQHIDYDAGRIFVSTVKHGEQSWQLLDRRLIPFLEPYDFRQVLSPTQLSFMFYRIEIKAGLVTADSAREYGMGWHSWRRYNDTVLTNILSQTLGTVQASLYLKIFMRWKPSSSQEMTEHYYTEDPLKIDAIVLENHPVAALWGE